MGEGVQTGSSRTIADGQETGIDVPRAEDDQQHPEYRQRNPHRHHRDRPGHHRRARRGRASGARVVAEVEVAAAPPRLDFSTSGLGTDFFTLNPALQLLAAEAVLGDREVLGVDELDDGQGANVGASAPEGSVKTPLALACSTAAFAQNKPADYPVRPIRIIIGVAAGAGSARRAPPARPDGARVHSTRCPA